LNEHLQAASMNFQTRSQCQQSVPFLHPYADVYPPWESPIHPRPILALRNAGRRVNSSLLPLAVHCPTSARSKVMRRRRKGNST
jgi:hypothetical protein